MHNAMLIFPQKVFYYKLYALIITNDIGLEGNQ